MYKGLIFSIKENYIIVQEDSGKFVKLRKRKGTKIGQYIAFFEEDIVTGINKKVIVSMVSVAAIILMVIIASLPQLSEEEVYAVVGLDINPSIRFDVGKDGVVIIAKGLNDDGSTLLMNEKLDGIQIKEALKLAINKSRILGFIKDEGQEVLISETIIKSYGYGDVIADESYLENIAEENNVKVFVVSTTEEILKESEEEGITSGKQYLADEIRENSNMPLKVIKKKSLKELLQFEQENKGKKDIKVYDKKKNDVKKGPSKKEEPKEEKSKDEKSKGIKKEPPKGNKSNEIDKQTPKKDKSKDMKNQKNKEKKQKKDKKQK